MPVHRECQEAPRRRTFLLVLGRRRRPGGLGWRRNPETRLCSTERCRSPPVRTRPFGELLAGTGESHISGRGISLGEVGRVDYASVGEYELLRPPAPELATGRRSFEGKGAARDDSESGSARLQWQLMRGGPCCLHAVWVCRGRGQLRFLHVLYV